MINKKDQAGNIIFEMMGFQYKPLEKRFLAECDKAKMFDVAKKYLEGSSILKIRILDKYMEFLESETLDLTRGANYSKKYAY